MVNCTLLLVWTFYYVQTIAFLLDTFLFFFLLLFYGRFLRIYFPLSFDVIDLKFHQNGLWVVR